MNNESVEDGGMAAEIDFGEGTRGLHHIPTDARVFLPTWIEKSMGVLLRKGPAGTSDGSAPARSSPTDR